MIPVPLAPDSSASPSSPVVLEYRTILEPAGADEQPRWLAAIFLLAAAPLVVVPFVPFTYNVSPLYAVGYTLERLSEQEIGNELVLVLMALPFFLGTPIVLWQARLLISRNRSTAAERLVAYGLASLTAMCSLALFAEFLYATKDNSYRWDPQTIKILTIPAMFLVSTGLLCFGLARRMRPHIIATIALHGAFLINGILCLAIWFDDRGAGLWLTLVGCAGLAAELLLVLVKMVRIRRALPLAL